MIKQPNVSIIIPNYNTRDLLYNCLSTLQKTVEEESKPEIIVVDNASNDGSVDMVKSCFAGIKLIKEQFNKGFAGAVNDGLQVASGELVLLLNTDILVLDKGLITRLSDTLYRYPDAAGVAPRLLNRDLSVQRSTYRWPSILREACHLLGLDPLVKRLREVLPISKVKQIMPVNYASGACLLLRKDVVSSVGEFDESFFMYHEEMELSYRLTKNGWRIYYDPNVSVIHFGGGSSLGIKPKVLEWRKSGLLYFFSKHYSRKSARILAALYIIVFSIRLVFSRSKEYRDAYCHICKQAWNVFCNGKILKERTK
ncbi:glycosyltransferase family 2 protein [Neomoorella mulderi]|uniref:N-acetylglucosaminyl-diphospho-decaprenol L-rhamnosyltransferase n=1 Tax=Moorella mulderi DSM 14980 TaxID=1122241 RepID=A0A151AYU4_9FIRM|nr:glycosyltransferase family 2 protein [Moorella mulderi]KYH32825.1 N-acetylglucosaminyl-diphospho-decaprenol L-rhamnosyltransferase [Moorella mulderi DSM 14980]